MIRSVVERSFKLNAMVEMIEEPTIGSARVMGTEELR